MFNTECTVHRAGHDKNKYSVHSLIELWNIIIIPWQDFFQQPHYIKDTAASITYIRNHTVYVELLH